MNSYNTGILTMYNETESNRGRDFAPGYDASRRYDYERRGRSPSPSRDRSPRRRGNREDIDLDQRVYDDFAANDYNRNRERDHCNDYDDFRNDRSNRYRDRRRSRSRSRSRERGRDRSRSSRDKREKGDSRERRRRETDAVDDYYIDRLRRRREADNYRRDEEHSKYEVLPSATVIVQNLGPDATERKIEDHLKLAGVSANNVAVIRDRVTGNSKGYAFVEFGDVDTAEKWINITKRNIVIDGRSAQLDFSKSKRNVEPTPILADWNCTECNALNFGSRKKAEGPVTCFKCGCLQKDNGYSSNSSWGKDKNGGGVIKLEPCNVLMLRGMSFSTTEEQIRMAIAKLTSHPIYDVRLIRDKVTDMSRGFAFVELGTSEHATSLLETIEKAYPPFEIDMRKITVGYARHGYNAPLNGKKTKSSVVSKQTVASNAVAQASATQATAEYSQSMADLYAMSGANSQSVAGGNSKHPQASTFTSYDPASGYYYDAASGLYYDPKSGYYYNGTTGQFLYWDGKKYQAVNQDGTPATASNQPENQSTTQEQKGNDSEKDKVNISGQKPKNARKIAKDMERWAKKMNNATEARKNAVKQAQDELKALEQKEEELRRKILNEKEITELLGAGTKDGIRSMFVPDNDEEGSVLKLASPFTSGSATRLGAVTNLVAATDPPDDDDDDFVDESKFVDQVKLACLLCKRQFPNKDVLTKHLQISQLHKQNLATYIKSKKKI